MKLSSVLIARILTLCGISLTCTSCYGIPPTGFVMNGKVTDGAGIPIEGIEVSAGMVSDQNHELPDEDDYYQKDGLSSEKAFTNRKGDYLLDSYVYGRQQGLVRIEARDVDGEAGGGSFATKVAFVEVESSDYYRNELEMTIDITMDPAEEDE